MTLAEKLYSYLDSRHLSGIFPKVRPVGAYISSGSSDCTDCNCSDPDSNCCFDCYDPCGNHCDCGS